MRTTRTVGVHEAKTQFSRLLRDVAAGGEIVVTRGGEPVARIIAVDPEPRAAESRGMFAGRFDLPEDFDADGDDFGDLFGLPR